VRLLSVEPAAQTVNTKRGDPMIKNISCLLILLFMASACAPSLKHIPKETEIIGFEFSEYSNKGFLITPGEYGENYETIGLLTFSIYPEANKFEVARRKTQPGKPATDKKWKIETINPLEAIELAYQEAIKRGADAITHFKIHFDSKEYVDGITIVKITGVQVSGLLIKRK
jgi:hypothetical protein